jgi:hypothetical protein
MPVEILRALSRPLDYTHSRVEKAADTRHRVVQG